MVCCIVRSKHERCDSCNHPDWFFPWRWDNETVGVWCVASAGLDGGMSRKEVASALTLGVEDHCPEFRTEYRATLIWQEWQ